MTHATPASDPGGRPPAERVLADRYRLEAHLGGGGMADVYRAVDIRLTRTVAVKVFRSAAQESGGRDRFQEEARLLASLDHPGLVTIYDAGTDSGELFLVMQLVEGTTLSGLIASGPMSPVEVADLGQRLASVLAYVHENGIMHRDVKPSNVLVASDGRVFLADFGISRLVDAAHRMTASGIVGTAGYLSPEQVLGADASYRVDVYALGLVLLECLTGQPEYPGTGIESAIARVSRPPRIPDDLPPALAETLRAMVADDPKQRPSAARCAELLDLAGSGGVTAAFAEAGQAESAPTVQAPAAAPAAAAPAAERTVLGTRFMPAGDGFTEVTGAAPDQHVRRRGRLSRAVWGALAGAVALIVLVIALLLGVFSGPPPAPAAPPLPPAQGSPGVQRLPNDLQNLERAVNG